MKIDRMPWKEGQVLMEHGFRRLTYLYREDFGVNMNASRRNVIAPDSVYGVSLSEKEIVFSAHPFYLVMGT